MNFSSKKRARGSAWKDLQKELDEREKVEEENQVEIRKKEKLIHRVTHEEELDPKLRYASPLTTSTLTTSTLSAALTAAVSSATLASATLATSALATTVPATAFTTAFLAPALPGSRVTL